MAVMLCDVAVGDIKIGQVVKLPKCYGLVVGIIAEYGGHFIKHDEANRMHINSPRYPEVRILLQNGRVSHYFYETMEFPLIDRVLKHFNLNQHPEGTEFYRFDKICEKESFDWKYV